MDETIVYTNILNQLFKEIYNNDDAPRIFPKVEEKYIPKSKRKRQRKKNEKNAYMWKMKQFKPCGLKKK